LLPLLKIFIGHKEFSILGFCCISAYANCFTNIRSSRNNTSPHKTTSHMRKIEL